MKRLKTPIEVGRTFAEKKITVVLYSLPSLEEGMYRYGMASGVTFESRNPDPQLAYDENILIRTEQQRLTKERMLSKGETEQQSMVKIMKACIATWVTRTLAEGDGNDIETSEAMTSFIKETVTIDNVLARYFNVGRYVGQFVHSPREIFDICTGEKLCEVVDLVMKGVPKGENACYMNAASLSE